MMVIIMIGLFISGVTAFPLETELVWLSGLFGDMPIIGPWLHKISEALVQTNGTYPISSLWNRLACICTYNIGRAFYWAIYRSC